MWCKHPDFQKLVDSATPLHITNPLNQLKTVMSKLQTLLSRLHKDNYVDLKAQQELARGELTRIQLMLQEDPLTSRTIQVEKEARHKYISILSSSMELMKQQYKMEWISYGDDNLQELNKESLPPIFAKSRMTKGIFWKDLTMWGQQ